MNIKLPSSARTIHSSMTLHVTNCLESHIFCYTLLARGHERQGKLPMINI